MTLRLTKHIAMAAALVALILPAWVPNVPAQGRNYRMGVLLFVIKWVTDPKNACFRDARRTRKAA